MPHRRLEMVLVFLPFVELMNPVLHDSVNIILYYNVKYYKKYYNIT